MLQVFDYLELKSDWLVDKIHFARDSAAIVTNGASVSQSPPCARNTSTVSFNKMRLVYQTLYQQPFSDFGMAVLFNISAATERVTSFFSPLFTGLAKFTAYF